MNTNTIINNANKSELKVNTLVQRIETYKALNGTLTEKIVNFTVVGFRKVKTGLRIKVESQYGWSCNIDDFE
jgi:hypothetical protein